MGIGRSELPDPPDILGGKRPVEEFSFVEMGVALRHTAMLLGEDDARWHPVSFASVHPQEAMVIEPLAQRHKVLPDRRLG